MAPKPHKESTKIFNELIKVHPILEERKIILIKHDRDTAAKLHLANADLIDKGYSVQLPIDDDVEAFDCDPDTSTCTR